MKNEFIRNVAIIAHVDHGKTTLVDAMFKQSGMFRESELSTERIMDNMDLERERGITIAAKNCSVNIEGVKINIIDTPGHVDFGGEVERALMMADGAILLVDSSEGPLPQTRFVVKKALEGGLKIIVVVNKIDRKDARPREVLDEIIDLFISLDATEEQIEFPILYAIGRDGIAKKDMYEESKDLKPLFEAILKYIPAPEFDPEMNTQLLVTDLNYSDYFGRLAIGKIFSGNIKKNDNLVCISEGDVIKPLTVGNLQVYDGLKLQNVDSAQTGEIVVLSGIENVKIGDTICNKEHPAALPRIHVDEPVVSMEFTVNTSPLSGRDGKYVQSGRLKERLFKETLKNVSIQIDQGEDANVFIVKGRGELQLAIIIETMRREGFEMSVGRPKVIMKTINGRLCEPIERLLIDCQDTYVGVVTEKVSQRKGRMINLETSSKGRVRMEFFIPSRGLIGYRSEFLTDTRGTGIMNTNLEKYDEFTGEIESRHTGSLVSDTNGKAVAYGLSHLEPRGVLFIVPNDDVYEGMIIGEHSKDNDLNVNPTKEKKMSNMRSVSKDDAIMLTPVLPMSLEKAIEFIKDDELVEVTPKIIRMRKRVLSSQIRHRMRGDAIKRAD